MPRIKLVTNVSEYALLRGLARTRLRLVSATAVMSGLTIAAGLWSAHYVLEVSSSVTLNLGLITVVMMLVLVSAYLQAVLVGDLFFGGPWREQVILGQKTEQVTVKDHSAEFMIVLMLLVVLNGLAINVSSGGFLDIYHTEGFFRSRLRAEDAAERRAALEDITDPLNFELWENTEVRRLVVGHLRDEDLEARKIAIWNIGEMKIRGARAELIEMVRDGEQPVEIRMSAAQTLGTLGSDEEARVALESLLAEPDNQLIIGGLRGLALMKSPLSVEAALPLTRAADESVMLHAFWVLRNSGVDAVREMLHEELEKSPSTQRRCAILDTLKMVATREDVIWARREFQRVDAEEKCEPVIWEERNERQHYVLYSDTLQEKYLKIVANASGGEHRAWFERLAQDPQHNWRIREVANEVVKRIDEAGLE